MIPVDAFGVFVHVPGATHYVPRSEWLKAYGRAQAVAIFKSKKGAEKYVLRADPHGAQGWVVRQLQD